MGSRRAARRSWIAGRIQVVDLGAQLRGLGDDTERALSGGRRSRKPKAAKADESKPRCFVLRFNGDLHASAVERLRHEVTALLALHREGDEVVLVLESSGGTAHDYGLAASQLERLRDRDITLTVTIDRVAASGGYLMACVGHEIVAAPHAIVGSIGVIVELPNFHRLLQKHGVDWELHTAGESKRLVTMFGKNDEKGRELLRAKLAAIHGQFRNTIAEYRTAVDIDSVATGENWPAATAKVLHLVDRLGTTDDLLLARAADGPVYELWYEVRRTPRERLLGRIEAGLVNIASAVLERVLARIGV